MTASAGAALTAAPLIPHSEAIDTLIVACGEGAEVASENPILSDWARRCRLARRDSVSIEALILVPISGSALAPLAVSSTFPTSFSGVTDAKGPITNVTFTETNSSVGEMDPVTKKRVGGIEQSQPLPHVH
jgi:hypothetical protein